METRWNLFGRGAHPVRLITRDRPSRPARSISPVLTVTDLCRRLGKSRRHLYRLIRSGRLQPCGRVLGQWLFAPEAVGEVARRQVPNRLRRVFWDARLSDISLERHQDFVVGRVLEFGDPASLRWLFRTYARKTIAEFLNARGAAVLSKRAWNFWALQLGVSRRRRPRSWRQRGRAWGGLA